MRFDVIVIGGGPAGCSAALTLRARSLSTAIVTGAASDIPLSASSLIANYPGCPGVSGRELLDTMRTQAERAGAVFLPGHAIMAAPMGEGFGVSVGTDFHECGALILCTGVGPGVTYPGETELLGRGVSYCATCDGMLYRGKDVCVLGFTADGKDEADALSVMGCRVKLFTDKTAKYTICGNDRVTALSVNGEEHPCQAVFILRSMSAPDVLVPGIALDGRHIQTDNNRQTSVEGIFAAGDCIGKPYQVAKAVGDGNVAALSAAAWLDRRKKERSI